MLRYYFNLQTWRVVIEHEFERVDCLFVNIISLDWSAFKTSVKSLSVYWMHQNQIEDDSEPDPASMKKSKSPHHQRIGENLNVQDYSQY